MFSMDFIPLYEELFKESDHTTLEMCIRDRICTFAVKIKSQSDLQLCASMGLLKKAQLQKLMDAGISGEYTKMALKACEVSSNCP